MTKRIKRRGNLPQTVEGQTKFSSGEREHTKDDVDLMIEKRGRKPRKRGGGASTKRKKRVDGLNGRKKPLSEHSGKKTR